MFQYIVEILTKYSKQKYIGNILPSNLASTKEPSTPPCLANVATFTTWVNGPSIWIVIIFGALSGEDVDSGGVKSFNEQ